MSNLPLKPLVWLELASTNRLICEVVTPICEYSVWKDVDSVAYSVLYYNRHTEAPTKEATGFSTIDEAKQWAWKHYKYKMQPYVKPSLTWIDASERLPESECFYLVRLFDGHRDEHVFVILWWNSEHQQFLEWDAMCEPTHWMPIPEFSTMQNNKGERLWLGTLKQG